MQFATNSFLFTMFLFDTHNMSIMLIIASRYKSLGCFSFYLTMDTIPNYFKVIFQNGQKFELPEHHLTYISIRQQETFLNSSARLLSPLKEVNLLIFVDMLKNLFFNKYYNSYFLTKMYCRLCRTFS